MNFLDHSLLFYLAVLSCPVLLFALCCMAVSIAGRLKAMHQEVIDAVDELKKRRHES